MNAQPLATPFQIEPWLDNYSDFGKGRHCLRIDGAYIDYEFNLTGALPVFWILLIRTDEDLREQGLATKVIDTFFREVGDKHKGIIYPGEFAVDTRGRSLSGTFYRAAAKHRFVLRHDRFMKLISGVVYTAFQGSIADRLS